MCGALVAAATGLHSLWVQFVDRRDRYLIRWGPLELDDRPGLQFYVINVGKHDVTMLDYGYVYADGYFSSIPAAAASQYEEDGTHTCSLLSVLQPHRPQQAGGWLGQIDAAYAISTTQGRPQLAFRPGVPIWKRWWMRVRIAVLGDTVRRHFRAKPGSGEPAIPKSTYSQFSS